MAKSKFYVVWKGRQAGVYSNWESCKMQIEGFKGAQYKSFPDRQSAEDAFKAGYQQTSQRDYESARLQVNETTRLQVYETTDIN